MDEWYPKMAKDDAFVAVALLEDPADGAGTADEGGDEAACRLAVELLGAGLPVGLSSASIAGATPPSRRSWPSIGRSDVSSLAAGCRRVIDVASRIHAQHRLSETQAGRQSADSCVRAGPLRFALTN